MTKATRRSNRSHGRGRKFGEVPTPRGYPGDAGASSGQPGTGRVNVNTTSVGQVSASAQAAATTGTARAATTNRPFLSPPVRGPQSLIFPGMVMLGCWLMAFTFFYFSTDPNRNLFGGMAVLMALLWTFSFGVRVRKLLLRARA